MTFQAILIILFAAALAAAAASFVLAGWKQARRTAVLGRKAHESGMRFSAEDIFEAPRRYDFFSLIDSGHSQRASNVTYGRAAGLTLRAFDFRYEIGHGTGRVGRHYGVAIVELPGRLPELILWNRGDLEYAPLAVRSFTGQVGSWRYRGPADLAGAVAGSFADFGEQNISIQAFGNCLMLCAPAKAGSYACSIDRIPDLLEVLRENVPSAWQEQSVGSLADQGVEKSFTS